ncbi:TolC family protein [Deefgea piscis]|uniref:TolC family protein n=1 Tax=Deefgea piscis TaxID=2739061 RepID=A0A6M8STZ1_9NEIS|nr:TolC family protein [Deefgea piscis]QKJ66946.1 TolC family protein [Deefgea piscis]
MRHFSCPRLASHLCLAGLISCIPVSAIAVTFESAQQLALTNAPQLRASHAQITAAQQLAIPAGELPDPKIKLAVDNLPVSGPDRFNPSFNGMAMQTVALMQEFPNRDKRNARIQAANARIAISEMDNKITQQNVARDTAQAWITQYSVEQQLRLIDALEAENQLFSQVIQAQLASGKGSISDTILPKQERARLGEMRDELSARRAQAMAQLKRWVGIAANEGVTGQLPTFQIDAHTLQNHLANRPELATFDPKGNVLNAEIAEARAGKTPDWGVELKYQRNPHDDDSIMLEFSFDLPIFSGQRQDPMIAAKVAEKTALDAEREASLRERSAELANDIADLQRLQQANQRYQTTLIPLAAEKISLTLSAWKSGKAPLSEVIAARRDRLDTQLKAIAVTGELHQLQARLHFTYHNAITNIAANTAGAAQ